MRTISAADANRYFSKLLREVAAGDPVVVTSRGKPLVKIAPVDEQEQLEAERIARERQAEWDAHVARLQSQPALNLGKITRDEIYDD